MFKGLTCVEQINQVGLSKTALSTEILEVLQTVAISMINVAVSDVSLEPASCRLESRIFSQD